MVLPAVLCPPSLLPLVASVFICLVFVLCFFDFTFFALSSGFRLLFQHVLADFITFFGFLPKASLLLLSLLGQLAARPSSLGLGFFGAFAGFFFALPCSSQKPLLNVQTIGSALRRSSIIRSLQEPSRLPSAQERKKCAATRNLQRDRSGLLSCQLLPP